MKSLIITGASGFVGGNMVEYFSRKGYKVYAIVRSRDLEHELIGNRNVVSIRMDLGNYQEIMDKLSRTINSEDEITAILHFGAQMVGSQVKEYIDNTIMTTWNLLKYAIDRKITSFVYASSIAVYGMTEQIVNEKSDRVNLTDYGMAKYMCERLIQDSTIENRVVIRMPRMLGKRIDMSCPWLPVLTSQLIKGENITYYNPELLYNNMALCDDMAEFIDIMINRENKGYDMVGLGASEPMKVIEIVNYMKKLLDSNSIIQEGIPAKRNTCFGIDISKAISMGFKNRTVKETLEIFCNIIKEENVMEK